MYDLQWVRGAKKRRANPGSLNIISSKVDSMKPIYLLWPLKPPASSSISVSWYERALACPFVVHGVLLTTFSPYSILPEGIWPLIRKPDVDGFRDILRLVEIFDREDP